MDFLFKWRQMKWPQMNFSGHSQYIRVMKTTEKTGYSMKQAEY